jgi:hypothetical protein
MTKKDGVPAPLFYDPPLQGGADDPRRVAYVPVSMIQVDQNVQRATTTARLDGMLHDHDGEFDWGIFEVLTVTVRDNGDIVATEGQHRALLAKREVPDAWTWVVINPGTNEAATALAIARGRKGHTSLQKWNLRLHDNGLMEALAEQKLTSLGLALADRQRWDGITAVGAVERVMKTFVRSGATGDELEKDLHEGAELLDTVLSLLTSVWNVKSDANTQRLDGHLIQVAARLISRNERLQLDRLARVLGAWGPPQWLAKGKERHASQSFNEAVAQAIIPVYNRGPLAPANQIRW